MGKKMKLIPFLFKPTEQILSSSSSSWPWPNCGSPKTLSFRAEKIMNSVFVANESRYINSSVCESSTILSTIVLEEDVYSGEAADQTIENVIRGAKTSSERLFFDYHAGETTSCLLADQHLSKTNNKSITTTATSTTTNRIDCVTSNDRYKYCTSDKVLLMEMDSRDPYDDFKKSMEEMVEANGFNVKDDWESLHQLLKWYLQVNDKSNQGYIVGAFVDLLVSLEYSSASSAFSSPTSSSSSSDYDHNNSSSSSATVITQSPVSALSFSSNYSSTGPCLLTLFEEEEEEEDGALDHRRST
ncbi:Transcription repressor [Heracleum sosnowskyi]|uniref:Transcription repressor n=1 Tax=Heracleum sosnowskyi TaxID=360622 RepID=A0AAD8JMK4_9APIA|nr:Transcription repressor [Heracleum sosnowskyi]